MTATDGSKRVETPYLRVEDTGQVFELTSEVTTVGRGEGIDVAEVGEEGGLLESFLADGGNVGVFDLGMDKLAGVE